MYTLSAETSAVFTRRVESWFPPDSDPSVATKSEPVTAEFVLLSIHTTDALADNPVIEHDSVVSVPVLTSLLIADTAEIVQVISK